MTKQEVYENATLKEIGNNPQGTRMDIIFRAMDEYAKEQAIAFVNALLGSDNSGYIKPNIRGAWYRGDEPYADGRSTTKNMYEDFIKRQQTPTNEP